MAVHGQQGYGVRLDWGPVGAMVLAQERGCLVVVDVLSFTTTVSVAVQRGTAVYPYGWRDASAAEFARRHDAALAVGRREVSDSAPWSLSPAAIGSAPVVPRLVLPSPNGSAIARAGVGGTVVASSLRNYRAAAEWLLRRGFGSAQRPVSVAAAGERWPDDSLRPALEDLLGAGALIHALDGGRAGPLSPEARAAGAVFRGTPDVADAVMRSASGVELRHDGFGADVEVAVELDVSRCVAVLDGEAFRPVS